MGWGPGAPPSKKARKAAAQASWAAAPASGASAARAPVVKKAVAVAQSGHPSCTSEADCIGSPTTQIIQHMIDGEAGDLYCKLCWDSFVKRNPELEGVPV